MADQRYTTPAYRKAKREANTAQARGEWLTCHETICRYPTRDIAPTQGNDIAHDETGTTILGPAHPRCNRSEGATRGNRERGPNAQNRWTF